MALRKLDPCTGLIAELNEIEKNRLKRSELTPCTHLFSRTPLEMKQRNTVINLQGGCGCAG